MRTPSAKDGHIHPSKASAHQQGDGVALPAQRKTINIGDHGDIWVPDAMNLAPDVPQYGGIANVGSGMLKYPAATSMEALVTPNHPKGSSPKELKELFNGLPTKGSYHLGQNNKKTKDGSTLYIKGHLLNDNLGGPGTAENLFPITHQANVDHERKVEEPIKEHVNNEGGAVHYTVTVTNNGTGTTDVFANDTDSTKLAYVNATFNCTVKEYNKNQAIKTHNATITSTWGGTDNSGQDKMVLLDKNTHGVASTFDAKKVKWMPRAIAKKEWEDRFIRLVHHLANAGGKTAESWLIQNVQGVGKVNAQHLLKNTPYEGLKKGQRASLTRAREGLKDLLDVSYSDYLGVFVLQEDEVELNEEEQHDATVLEHLIGRLELLTQVFNEYDDGYELFLKNSVSIKHFGPKEVPKPYSTYETRNKNTINVKAMKVGLEMKNDMMLMHIEITQPNDEVVKITEDITSQSQKIAQLSVKGLVTINHMIEKGDEVLDMMIYSFRSDM